MATWTYTDQINDVGDPIDAEVFAEIKSNVVEALGTTSTTSTFNGTTGRQITIADQGNTNYLVLITPTADPNGYLGEVWVVNNSSTQFTVYCSGTASSGFRYKVVK